MGACDSFTTLFRVGLAIIIIIIRTIFIIRRTKTDDAKGEERIIEADGSRVLVELTSLEISDEPSVHTAGKFSVMRYVVENPTGGIVGINLARIGTAGIGR